MTLSESPNNASMSFKTCRQLIHEDFRKVLTQQPHGKISEYLLIYPKIFNYQQFIQILFLVQIGQLVKRKEKSTTYLYPFMDDASALHV